VADAHGVIRVLTADCAIGFAVEVAIITGRDERFGLLLLAALPLDEAFNLRMVHVQAHHLGSAARRPPALGCPSSSVEHLQEAHQATGSPAPRELFLLSAYGAEVAARPRPVLE